MWTSFRGTCLYSRTYTYVGSLKIRSPFAQYWVPIGTIPHGGPALKIQHYLLVPDSLVPKLHIWSENMESILVVKQA
jgi:hypothetical protein